MSNKLDLIIVTSNVDLKLGLYISALNPGFKRHVVGVVIAFKSSVFPCISHERSIGGSPHEDQKSSRIC